MIRSSGIRYLVYFLMGLFLAFFQVHGAQSAEPSSNHSSSFILSGYMAVDLRTGAEWMRCSVGQVFQNDDCTGDAIKLTQDEVRQAIEIANDELGGIWRLPTLEELEFLVCKECPAPKIDKVVFPKTLSEPYWTGQENWVSPKNIWSVNFMTGFSYGRFFPYQSLAVRLVRDR